MFIHSLGLLYRYQYVSFRFGRDVGRQRINMCMNTSQCRHKVDENVTNNWWSLLSTNFCSFNFCAETLKGKFHKLDWAFDDING